MPLMVKSIHFLPVGLRLPLLRPLNRKRRSLPLPTISTWQQSRNRATNPPISDSRNSSLWFQNLKASDFDYIIFDMPPITQTSPTIGLAALMDKVLIVVEAEKTHRDVVKRGYRELVGARADVAVVLNKTRSYGPNWLESGS